MKKINFEEINKNDYFLFLLRLKKINTIFTKELTEEKKKLLNDYAIELKIENLIKSSKEQVNFIYLCKIVNSYDDLEIIKKNHSEVINNKKKLSIKKRILLVYGEEKYQEYTNKMKEQRKNQDRSNCFSRFQKEYWLHLGYKENDAIILAKEAATSSGKKGLEKRTNESYKNLIYKFPHSKKYWYVRGYSKEETEILRKPFLDEMVGSKERYIKKYGLEEGLKKHFIRQEKRKLTYFENHGSMSFNGLASKESLKFFIPLYKKIRKLGITKEDICWGIRGSKEFLIRRDYKENYVYFYDFVIKSKKIIIEYNNIAWHPREDSIDKCVININEAKIKDEDKINLAKSKGFDVIIIWNDDNFKEKEEFIIGKIK